MTFQSIAAEGKHLFILSGQSNMQGHRPDEAFTPAVQKEFGADNVIVVQHALGGQPIHRWYKKWKDPQGNPPADKKQIGDLYDALMVKVKEARGDSKIATVSFFWMQGERDAKMEWGPVYEKSLRGLINQLKRDLKREDVNVIIGRLSDFDLKNEKYPHWTIVRETQVKVAETTPRAVWVDTDDLNTGKARNGKDYVDDLHYAEKGYAEFGKRMAAASIKLIKKHPKK
ncbi:MAG: sialate O-acetylesterase [Planctomycetota bacterium]